MCYSSSWTHCGRSDEFTGFRHGKHIKVSSAQRRRRSRHGDKLLLDRLRRRCSFVARGQAVGRRAHGGRFGQTGHAAHGHGRGPDPAGRDGGQAGGRGRVQKGRRAGRGPAGRYRRGQVDVAADTVVPPGPAGRRHGGRPAGRGPVHGARDGHRGQHRPYRRRDGMSDGLRGGRARGVRHVQGRQQGHGHRARQAAVQNGRQS